MIDLVTKLKRVRAFCEFAYPGSMEEDSAGDLCGQAAEEIDRLQRERDLAVQWITDLSPDPKPDVLTMIRATIDASEGNGRSIDGILRELGGENNCDHPWHRNPGLITACPECGEGGER